MKAKIKPTVQYERVALHERIPLATPLVVYIEPSGFCNFKCIFCPQGSGGRDLKKDLMTTDLFCKIIDDLTMFPDLVKLLRICGNGEPLINKDIVSMLQYARAQKRAERIELVTNGSLLTTDLIKTLPFLLDRIIISIEGLCSQDYQRTSGAKVNFDKLLEHINDLYACKGKCLIHIKITDKDVLPEEKKVMFLNTFGDICDEIYIEKLVPMWPQFDGACSPRTFRWDGVLVKHTVCAQIFKGVQVQADGEVVPCCVDWKRVNVLGNINKNSVYEIWNGERLRRLQIEHLIGNKSKTEPCKDCTMNDYCEVDNIDSHAKECLKRLCG